MTPVFAALIPNDAAFALFAVLLAASALGLIGEARGWYRNFAGILVTLIATALLTIAGVLPSNTGPAPVPAYSVIAGYLMPLAVPLLLFNADLRRIARECGRLLALYVLGAFTVLLGVGAAVLVIDLGDDTWAAAALYTATWTGGFMNFMATADTLGLRGTPVFLSAVTSDGILNTLLLVVLFLLPTIAALARFFPSYREASEPAANPDAPGGGREDAWSVEGACVALAFGTAVLAVAGFLAPPLQRALGLNFRLDLILTTLVTLLAVNLLPARFARWHASAFPIGVLLLYLFVAEIGTGINLGQLAEYGPSIFVFGAIVIVVHLAVLLALGALLRFSLKEICLASNACIGGPTTAAPMAVSFGMKQAVTPAILVGLFGYTIGTFLGVTVGALLR